MRRQLKRVISLGLAVTMAVPPTVMYAAPAPKHGGTCVSGDCVNGFGTVRGKSNEYTGNWSNSWFTAGSYAIRYSGLADKSVELVIDAQRFPVRGTVQRGSDWDKLHNPTFYTGTFARVYHPFEKKYVPRYAHGRYTDGSDVVYDGDFDFVPARNSGANGGYYIFQGVRIDEEADQVRPGLYISDWTDSDALLGDFPATQPIIFRRATPDYVVKLQDDLRQDLQEANAEEAAKLSKERESREAWSSLFKTALGFAAVVGVMQVASRSSGSASSLSAVSNTLSGKQTSQDATAKMAADLRERAKSDPVLAKRIGNASDAELVAQMKQAASTTPTTMTVAEYRSAAGKPAAQPAESARAMPSNDNATKAASALKAEQDLEKKRQETAQRAKEASDRAREQEENRQRIAKEKADRLAAQQAEKAAEQQAQKEYLNTLIQGIRLAATKCPDGEGHYYATGSMPKVKKHVVSCIDVSYEAICPGSRHVVTGVAKNFVGMSGCFGDTYKIDPKPACDVKDVRIRVTDVTPGCN